jgi:hypothetical protein
MKSWEFMGNRNEELEGQQALKDSSAELESFGLSNVDDVICTVMPPITTTTFKKNTLSSIELTINTI